MGAFRIEFIKTNHSIADASALAIFSPAGIVIHTGDFKVDYTPVFGDAIDLQRFGELGKKGVLALMCDSTNAERPGFTMSERTVGKTFDNIFAEHKNTRIIIATFASNVDRVQQIINSAYKYGRKVVIEGRSMVNVIDDSQRSLAILTFRKTLSSILRQMKNYPDEQMVLVTTGSQGESMAALSRMAANMHRKVQVKSGRYRDFKLQSDSGQRESCFQDHQRADHDGSQRDFPGCSCFRPCLPGGDQADLFSGASEICDPGSRRVPSYESPGGYCRVLGHSEGQHFHPVIPEMCWRLDEKKAAKLPAMCPCGSILVDGLGVGDVGNIVLRDRQHLAEDGILIVVLTLERFSNQLLAGPDIVSRGFVYVRESEGLMEEARHVVEDAITDCLDKHVTDWGKIKNVIKDSLSDFLWKRTKRSPMILPIIMEV